MALPQDVLSTEAYNAPFLPPRNRVKLVPTIDWELGGTDLNDGTDGLEVKVWTCEYIDGTFVISAPGSVTTDFLTIDQQLRSMSFTFDQNMQPMITWENEDDEAYYHWFDPTIGGSGDFTTVQLAANTITPRCAMDDKRDNATLNGINDMILAYLQDGALYMRYQQDRFLTEYTLVASGLEGAELDQIGMNDLLRFQFRLYGGPSQIPAPISIERILRDLCRRTNVPDMNAEDHFENLIQGYSLTRETAARTAIQQIRTVGSFDIVERGEQLRFPGRGKPAVATLSLGDLGAFDSVHGSPGGPSLTTVRNQDFELPRQIRFRYKSHKRDYQVGEQLSPARIGSPTINDVTAETPIALDDDRASQTSEIIFREAWASRWSHQFAVDCAFMDLEPGDVLLLPVDGRLTRIRVVRIQDENFLVRKIDAVRDDDGSYVSIAVDTNPGTPPSVIILLGDTDLGFINLPALQDDHDDAGFYMYANRAGLGTTWPGCFVFSSPDDGETYSQIATIATEAITGTINTAPAVGSDGYTWDYEREWIIDLNDVGRSLSSHTADSVLAGNNAAAVGGPGNWQIIQWQDAELVSPGQYRLTKLLHGRRGTERFIDTISAMDQFILLVGGVIRVSAAVAQIGQSLTYRGVTNGAAFSSGTDEVFMPTGERLETFNPVHAKGSRDGSNNLTVTWVRRDRLSQTLRDGVTVPINESSEAYEIDVMNAAFDTVLDTKTSISSPTYNYTAAAQDTDYGSSGGQNPVYLRIYQLSADVGRGPYLQVTLQ